MREAPAAGLRAPSGTLLLVDDDRTVLRTLGRLFEAEGHRVHLADCVAQIQRPLQDPTLEVVLLDVVMCRGEDGHTLLPVLKARRPDVEVIVMTGHADIEGAVACMKNGAFHYLAKPFRDGQQLRDVVAQALRFRRTPRVLERPEDLPLSLDAYERLALERALQESVGDAVEAARRLGIGRSTLYRKLAKHRLAGRGDGAGGDTRTDRGLSAHSPIG